MDDPQSAAAVAVVGITIAMFTYRMVRKKSGVCGGGCACSMKPKHDLKPKLPETKTPE